MFKVEKIKSIGVKKIIALSMVFSYILFTAYSMIMEKKLPESFVTASTMILAYYFGRDHGESNSKTPK